METVLGICFYRKSMFFFFVLFWKFVYVSLSSPRFLVFCFSWLLWLSGLFANGRQSHCSLCICCYTFFMTIITHTHTHGRIDPINMLLFGNWYWQAFHIYIIFFVFSLLFVAFFFGYELDFHNNGMSCPSCCSSGRTYPSCFDSIREKEKKIDQTMTPLSSNEFNHSNNNFFFFPSQKDCSCEIMTST